MQAIRILCTLDSETLYLPELKPMLGKNVEIIILEAAPPKNVPEARDWDSALKSVDELEDYDFDAIRRQREYDFRHARDHLP